MQELAQLALRWAPGMPPIKVVSEMPGPTAGLLWRQRRNLERSIVCWGCSWTAAFGFRRAIDRLVAQWQLVTMGPSCMAACLPTCARAGVASGCMHACAMLGWPLMSRQRHAAVAAGLLYVCSSKLADNRGCPCVMTCKLTMTSDHCEVAESHAISIGPSTGSATFECCCSPFLLDCRLLHQRLPECVRHANT
jgi:hypothetical protein